jgi:hypothetical protein
VASGLAAVLAALALVSLGPAGTARADEPVDQITGNGDSTSTVTASWSQGLLGADNKTVVTARNPVSPYAFMYPDFQDLKVTVTQTENVVHQAILVQWSGGKPTLAPFQGQFLQLMQCYGDARTGPDPENCEYGSFGLLPSGVINPGIGSRSGGICAPGSAPSTSNPPGTLDGSGASVGCDPTEPASGGNHVAPCPDGQTCLPGNYSVPFTPVGSTDKIYGQATDQYDQFSTNEVQEASTGADGTGQQFFQALTAVQAPGLGCGLPAPDGRPRGCWLVIVPRGQYEPNGWKINGSTGIPGFLNESPLGAATWAQRIQIHLGFDLVQPNCPIGSAKERQTIGTQLVARAVFSWQLALNTAANCATIYGYAATPEASDTTQLVSPTGAGLAFTTVPIGSESVRNGGPPANPPPLVYAPVAASAITLGFNINQGTGVIATHIKLTPRLLAKALSQSYRFDLPDVDSNHAGPAWASHNPNFITDDPEFRTLNPGIATPPSGSPLAPLLTQDHSGVNQQVWAWIQADPAARAWLAGAPDENAMVVNPNYSALALHQAPAIDSYPRADPTCFNTGAEGERDPGRCTLNLLPYVENFDDAATRIRAANNPEGASWDPSRLAPDGSQGWWGNGGVEPAGRVFLWGVTNSSDLANLGLVPADLCDAGGNNCVAPSTASVSTALATARADTSGLLHVDPAAPGAGGYPLVSVTYAAVRLAQEPAALTDFAALINFAAGPGQTPGVEPGELPYGYLPLPDRLRGQAQAAVSALLAQARLLSTGTNTLPPNPSGPRVTAPSGPPTASPDSAGYTTTQATPRSVAKSTPATPVGPARWVLLAVLVVGLAGAIGGPLLRGLIRLRSVVPWRRR